MRFFIDSRLVTDGEIDTWETSRARAVLRRLARSTADDDRTDPPLTLEELRHRVADAKARVDSAEMDRLLRFDLAVSTRIAEAAARASFGRRRRAVCKAEVTGLTSSAFLQWFDDAAQTAAPELLSACPDHWRLRLVGPDEQEVTETTGGSPLATRFVIAFGDLDGVTTEADPDYPSEMNGAARSRRGGPVIGGIRHQFRNTDDGLRARLIVEFPAAFPSFMIARHRWHLACEFRHWFTAAGGA